MIRNLVWIILLISATADASSLAELKQVQDNPQLAKFIHRMVTENINLEELLDGLRSTEKLNVALSKTEVPVREVYGTIVAERFQVELGKDFYEQGRKYDVRGTCMFIDRQNRTWRFNIMIFEERQYNLMEQVVRKQIDRVRSK